jgi:hypothetical protein
MAFWDSDPGAFSAPGGVPPELLQQLLQGGALSNLLNPGEDPTLQAQQARDAAAATLAARMGKRTPVPSVFDTAAAGGLPDGSPGALPFAGLLSDAGGFAPAPSASSMFDLPPPANDPVARQPTIFQNGEALPRPGPIVPGMSYPRAAADDQPAAPFSLAPAGAGTDDPSTAIASGAADPMAGIPREGSSGASGAPAGSVPFSMAPGRAPITSPGNRADVEVPPAISGQPSGFLGKVFNPANAPTLLAMASGFTGAGSFGTGMRRAFGNAAAPAAQLRQEQMMQMGQGETYKALVSRGVSPQDALAAVRDPDLKKAMLARVFESKPLTVHDVTGPLGDKTPIVFNPNTGKFSDMAGKPMNGESDALGAAGAGGSLLAPGVKFDPNLTGEEYLGQFSPDVKAAVKAYIDGDVMPTGNPRSKAIATYAKTVAQRYGQDMGIPVSDATFAEKRKYRTELGSGSANSAGGQVKAFNQGIEHADALATKLEKLGNWNGLGFPWLAGVSNTVREATDIKQKGLADEARTLGQTLAGEVGKLFSGSAGGGVHERELTRQRFDTVKSTPELAGALEGTIETMEGGLRALEQRRDAVLGPKSDVKFTTPETEAKIARIRDVISRLKGETSAAPAAPTAPAAPVAPLKPGQTTTINGVTIRRVD